MKKAFTLVELIIVIAIVAILSALIVPAIKQAYAAKKQKLEQSKQSSIILEAGAENVQNKKIDPLEAERTEHNVKRMFEIDGIVFYSARHIDKGGWDHGPFVFSIKTNEIHLPNPVSIGASK